jgi:prolyl oligopeptidase
VRKKGAKLDGSAPALLTGYGGYAIDEQPWFRVENRLWLDLGGVFADANLRGGAEFGEEWHAAGKLVNKQHVFDDLYGCAQRLVETGMTRPERLAIEGGSNGGLLMGAELTQHPDAFRAVVSHVGIYDMLRVELTPNGTFNVTEFGTVKDEPQFRALLGYSPLHHVVDGTKYPAVLFLTGVNDPRVDPWHSRKMTARLQAATSSGLPVLLRTSGNTGHGIGTPLDEHIEQAADVHAFLVEQLGIAVP